MKINLTSTRKTGVVRWSLVAAAAVALASLTPLSAQDPKKDEEKRQQDRKRTPPPATKGAPTQSAPAAQAVHPTPPPQQPATTQPTHTQTPVTAPPVNNQAPPRERREVTPPSNPNSGRQFGTREQNPERTPPTVNNQNQGRTPPTVNNQNQGRTPPPVYTPNQGRTPPPVTNQNQGRQFGNGAPPRAPNQPSVYHGPNNTQVQYRANGQPREVHTRDMTIVHSPVGTQRVMVERPDHTVIVTNHAGHGYVQRPFVVHNTTYVQRTYYVSGRPYTRIYRPYTYGGLSLNIYVPGRYYAPGYYTWAYNPWATPVSYRWGWYSSPWYGYYGGYFTPYPTYASAAFWLTDYLIASTLERAYQDRMDAQIAANTPMYSDGAALTPEVKQAISDEVRYQLDQEKREGQAGQNGYDGAPAFLSDNSSHVFVVANPLDVPSRDGECMVTEGDVLQMRYATAPGSPSADVFILASKGGDCRKGAVVTVSVADLADMQNHMRETMDQGLADLQSKQGQGGIPLPPPPAQAAPTQAQYAAMAPPPDPNVASELNQQAQAATQAETEVLSQAQAAAPDTAGTPTVSAGMSIDEVVSIMGKPLRIGDLGSKKTYFYDGMKIVFTDGKVTDIQ